MQTLNIVEALKEANGYEPYPTPRACKGCLYFREDHTTDNFGPGDRCVRNPDITFATNPGSVCNKWLEKEKRDG